MVKPMAIAAMYAGFAAMGAVTALAFAFGSIVWLGASIVAFVILVVAIGRNNRMLGAMATILLAYAIGGAVVALILSGR